MGKEKSEMLAWFRVEHAECSRGAGLCRPEEKRMARFLALWKGKPWQDFWMEVFGRATGRS